MAQIKVAILHKETEATTSVGADYPESPDGAGGRPRLQEQAPLLPRHHGIVETVMCEPLVALDACIEAG
jgi:hypothetical protein